MVLEFLRLSTLERHQYVTRPRSEVELGTTQLTDAH